MALVPLYYLNDFSAKAGVLVGQFDTLLRTLKIGQCKMKAACRPNLNLIEDYQMLPKNEQ